METSTKQYDQSSLTFSDFNSIRKMLVSDLKKLKEFYLKLKIVNFSLLDDVVTKLENQSFSVAIIGEYKRGKTTLINALLGKDILPTDIKPCSASINRITYSLNPLVKIIFKDGREEEVSIDKLKDYITKLTPESEKIASNVKEAVIYYPTHYCQNNVDIIDTPGLNDNDSMDLVTLSVLPQVDAAIVVILAQAPFSEYERAFLEDKLMISDLGRIIFVVNGIDRCDTPENAETAVNYIRDRIQENFLDKAKKKYGENSPEYEVYQKKIGIPRVFGLSAWQALKAKETGDTALLAKSHFPEFESALEKFLAEERGVTLLQVPIIRAIASATEILKTISIHENGLAMEEEKFHAGYDKSVAEINDLRSKKAKEMEQIDRAAETVKVQVSPLVVSLEGELKQAVNRVITATEIDPSELSNKKALQEKLARKVSDAVQKAALEISEKIRDQIEHGLVKELHRSPDFAGTVDQALEHIEMQFIFVDVSLLPYQYHYFTGGWLTNTFFVEQFKENCRKEALELIENHLKQNQIDRQVNQQIALTFEALKQQVRQEVEALLENIQSTLTDLRANRERYIFLSENRLQELKQMKEDTKQIQDNAQRLSRQLIQITSTAEQVVKPEIKSLSLTNKNYKKVLIDLLYDVSQLREFCRELKLEQSISLIDNVVERIKNKSFTVGIFGEFMRGKTILLNALLGRDILPNDIRPSTATIQHITYGLNPLVKVIFKDGREEEVNIDKWKDYVPESEKIASNVREAVIYYPTHYCQNNVDIIDTPRLNDNDSMDQVTLSVLPKVDAAIVVIRAQSPFGESERAFIEDKLMISDLGRIIFVVNGIDRCNTPEDAETAVSFIRDRIQKNFLDKAKEKHGDNSPEYEVYQKKIGTPRVFGLSALQALKAKETGDTALLASSHFPEFEAALEKLVTQERGMISLQVLVNRAMSSATEILQSISLREKVLTVDSQQLQATYETLMGEQKVLLYQAKGNINFQDFLPEMENIQNTILELKVKHIHEETLIEIEQGKLHEMRSKTEMILANAQNLFE
ncbi:MAG: dynamin family protein [Microcoleus sp.]